jgi:hypothetical protein
MNKEIDRPYGPLHSHSILPAGSVDSAETCALPATNTRHVPQGPAPLVPAGLCVRRHTKLSERSLLLKRNHGFRVETFIRAERHAQCSTHQLPMFICKATLIGLTISAILDVVAAMNMKI